MENGEEEVDNSKASVPPDGQKRQFGGFTAENWPGFDQKKTGSWTPATMVMILVVQSV